MYKLKRILSLFTVFTFVLSYNVLLLPKKAFMQETDGMQLLETAVDDSGKDIIDGNNNSELEQEKLDEVVDEGNTE